MSINLVAEERIALLQRALVERDAEYCTLRAERDRLAAEQKALVSSLSDLNICCEAHMADVERLTAERASLQIDYRAHVGALADVKAERDRLREQAKLAMAEAQDVRERWIPKCDRLRAALERIAAVDGSYPGSIAREALADTKKGGAGE